MARRLLFWSAALLLGALIGAGSAWWTISRAGGWFDTEFDGGWRGNALAGAEAADPYTRAIVARTGLLALSARETIYFTLAHDENGRPLDDACVYELSGGALPARWWSVTIYAPDNYLPRNGEGAFSIDATRARPASDGRWRARIAAVRGEAVHWISSRAAHRGYTLMLRLYQPRQEARQHPETIPFPTIATVSCPEQVS
jgi:hypothetical protein